MNRIEPSWADIENWCDALATAIVDAEIEVNMVIGISRGGLIPATMISHMLGVKRLGSFQLTSYDSTLKGSIQDLEDRHHLMASIERVENVLVVEDIVDTGDSMAYLRKRFGHMGAKCAYAALSLKSYKAPHKTWPDFWAHNVSEKAWVSFPWEKD